MRSRCTGYRPILDAFRVFAKGDSTAYTEEAIAASRGQLPGQNGNGMHANGANGHGMNGSNGHRMVAAMVMQMVMEQLQRHPPLAKTARLMARR